MAFALFTTAIILGILFIFIILFVLSHKKGINKKLNQQKVITADIIWKNKLDITEQETINNNVLAIDTTNFVLLYINFKKEKEEIASIDLWQIRSVKVRTEDNTIYEQRKDKSVLVDKQVTKLQMEITTVNGQQKNELVLYEYKDGMQDFVHIKKRADYWCDLINKALHELPSASTPSSKYA